MIAIRGGAHAVLEALEAEGVQTIFGYPGGAIMPLYDALYGHSIRHVLVRHEAAAVFAASGFARTTGRVGVCCATSGPGATNLVTGLLDASMDSIPLVAITGQVRSTLMGTDGFQEADVCAITQPVTKANILIRDPKTIAREMRRAFAIASGGRPGPVLVDIPSDILKAAIDHAERASFTIAMPHVPIVDRTAIARAADLVRRAKRPLAIVGGGVRRGEEAVAQYRRLVAMLGVPHTATINGLGAGEPGDHHYLGMLGMHGSKAANLAVHRADVILALGMRFDDRVTGRTDKFAREAAIVHADIDPSEFSKIIPASVSLAGDLAATLRALCDELERSRIPRFDDWGDEVARIWAPPPSDKVDGLSATTIMDRLFAIAPGDTVVTTDVGQHQMWAAQRVRPDHPRNFATSAGLGAMGFGLPAAIGAQFAQPERNVVTVVGDGGFQMSLTELATLRRYKLPVKILLIDNRNLGMVRQWQELFYNERYSATNLSDNPDFVAIAKAYDIHADVLDCEDDIDRSIAAFLAHDGPMLLHCVCYPAENVWPMIPVGGAIDEGIESKP